MKTIKALLVLSMSLLMVITAYSQKDKSNRPSPPAQVSKDINGTKITIDYSQPSKRGREVFGVLEKYGKVWRTGANESTWIELSKDVKVEGESLAAGKYGLFTIPGKDEWMIIFNKKWDGWGAYEYNEENDVLRVKVKSASTVEVVETFTIDINEAGDVILTWDQTKVQFAIR